MGLRRAESTPLRFPRPSVCGAVASGLNLGTNRVQFVPPRVARWGPVWNKGRSGIMQTALRLLDKDVMHKQRALDAALSQIERAFGKGSVMKLGSREAASDIDVISTGSLGLDIALGIGGGA